MAAPTKDDILKYPGANGTPDNDTDPYGGDIDTGSPLDDASVDILLSNAPQNPTDTFYHQLLYFKNTADGNILNARIFNRNAAKFNSSGGSTQYISTSSSDAGLVIKTVGLISGIYDYEYVTLLNLTPAAGSKTWDAGSIIRHEVLTSDLSFTYPQGNITGSVASQIITVIHGLNDTPGDSTLACFMTSAEYTFALASAVDTAIPVASPNIRLQPPASGVGSFSHGTFWIGDDQSLPVPGNVLSGGSYIGVVGKYRSYAGSPLPVINITRFHPVITGNPVA